MESYKNIVKQKLEEKDVAIEVLNEDVASKDIIIKDFQEEKTVQLELKFKDMELVLKQNISLVRN